ncbi:hypothetical protein T4B_7523 [Trichinella pseudospiralis]|uniref:Uncharacterized protein n=1 Tax=Trichinella pseudospiralis TaxID=6337 RepID=A0A0V1GQ96_TRIPS|nr:hypothetical protein T4B_7523 [Trichinella pseudospiralis]
MQITIAIKGALLSVTVHLMEQSKNENADDMKPITDVTKEEEQERKRAKLVICKIFFAVKQYCVVHYVEMSKEKVKTRTTRNKSQTAVLRRTRDEKRHAMTCFD